MIEPVATYTGLRRQILDLDPDSVNLTHSASSVYGVVMDWGFTAAVATLVGLSDGTTSCYLSNGGGMIGGGQHASVSEASRRWLELVEGGIDLFDQRDEPPLPEPRRVHFAALISAGHRYVQAAEDDLLKRRHPLWPVFFAGQLTLTEFRRVVEAQQAKAS